LTLTKMEIIKKYKDYKYFNVINDFVYPTNKLNKYGIIINDAINDSLIFSNFSYYEGDILNNEKHGHGIEIFDCYDNYDTDIVIEGNYTNGKRNGVFTKLNDWYPNEIIIDNNKCIGLNTFNNQSFNIMINIFIVSLLFIYTLYSSQYYLMYYFIEYFFAILSWHYPFKLLSNNNIGHINKIIKFPQYINNMLYGTLIAILLTHGYYMKIYKKIIDFV
jgi:hypothetical protein